MLSESIIYDGGYLGLFFVSFLAATLFPLGVEFFVLLMVRLNYNYPAIIFVAALGGYVGSMVNYYMAKHGTEWASGRFFKLEPERLEKIRTLYGRWGSLLLFFSWLPFVGEPLTLAGGILNIRLAVFSFWVIVGRLVRFTILILIATQPFWGDLCRDITGSACG